jgi:hypothetical protein
MAAILTGLPEATEYATFYQPYLARVARHPDAVTALREELSPALAFYRSIGGEQSLRPYGPGKWTPRETLGHVLDSERVFVFRALAFARGETQGLPGFDQDAYLSHGEFNDRPWASMVDEFELVRQSSLMFFASLPAAAWLRSGDAWNYRVTVRALGFIAAGHEAHHRAVIEARYRDSARSPDLR